MALVTCCLIDSLLVDSLTYRLSTMFNTITPHKLRLPYSKRASTATILYATLRKLTSGGIVSIILVQCPGGGIRHTRQVEDLCPFGRGLPTQKQAVEHQCVKRLCVRKSSADAFVNHLSQQTRQFLVLVVDVFDDLLRSWSKPAVTPV